MPTPQRTVLHNTTRFAAIELPSVDAAGRDACVVCVAATSVMDATPRIAEHQPEPPLVDTWSSLCTPPRRASS